MKITFPSNAIRKVSALALALLTASASLTVFAEGELPLAQIYVSRETTAPPERSLRLSRPSRRQEMPYAPSRASSTPARRSLYAAASIGATPPSS